MRKSKLKRLVVQDAKIVAEIRSRALEEAACLVEKIEFPIAARELSAKDKLILVNYGCRIANSIRSLKGG